MKGKSLNFKGGEWENGFGGDFITSPNKKTKGGGALFFYISERERRCRGSFKGDCQSVEGTQSDQGGKGKTGGRPDPSEYTSKRKRRFSKQKKKKKECHWAS